MTQTRVLACLAFVASFGLVPSAAAVEADGKPVALIGFGTDVKAMASDVLRPNRIVYELFINQWLDPQDYGKYSVLYFGEKLDGQAKANSWLNDPVARAAAEAFVADGGTIVVAGQFCLRQLLGRPNKKKPDPLCAKIVHMTNLVGRAKANFSKEGKSLGFADEAGAFVMTAEGQRVKAIADDYARLFDSLPGVRRLPVEGKWEAKPLGAPGTLKLPRAFPKRAALGKPKPRRDGLVLLDDETKAKIVVTSDLRKDCLKLAKELAWHLEKMTGQAFDIVGDVPANGPALVYRTLKPPEDFARGPAAYFKVWREGDCVFLGGEDTGKSRATTYVLEALGCRYLWPGATGKVIPKRTRLVLPELAVEDATSFVIRKLRTYGCPAWRDDKANRDFYAWHGLNDMRLMTRDNPGVAEGWSWGHYYGDFYSKYYKDHRDWFALQPDSTRELRLGSHPERPTFCLSNEGLVEETALRVRARFRANPRAKCMSICLPDGAAATQCMCEKCRALDPVNAAKRGIGVFFPTRRIVPYVASTDRVLHFMNRVAEKVTKDFPDKYLSIYAYGGYVAPPVKVVPHPRLVILSVAGYYTGYADDDAVERNLAPWASFGNAFLWRPNAHAGFYFPAPDNLGRRMFRDISLMGENGLFGVDYDTMSSEWATKPFMYYMVCRAHYNPDRLDYDSIADDYCRSGFGPGWREVRRYFDLVGEASDRAAAQNAKAPPATSWGMRVARRLRLPRTLPFDALDACLEKARAAAGGDASALFRIGRLQFANDLGRRMLKIHEGKATADEREATRQFIADYLAKDPTAYRPGHDLLKVK